MTGAEQAVRARAIALLAADIDLAGRLHGVFDGVPPRVSAPFVAVGGAESGDWGTKDRAGREVRLNVALTGVGAAIDDRAADRIDAVLSALRGAAEGWTIMSARVVRTRFAFQQGGGWRHDMVVRCRCLKD